MVVTSIQKPAAVGATIDVQDGEEIVVITADDELTLNDEGIGNLFEDTSPEEVLGTQWLQICRLCRKNPLFCKFRKMEQSNSN